MSEQRPPEAEVKVSIPEDLLWKKSSNSLAFDKTCSDGKRARASATERAADDPNPDSSGIFEEM